MWNLALYAFIAIPAFALGFATAILFVRKQIDRSDQAIANASEEVRIARGLIRKLLKRT